MNTRNESSESCPGCGAPEIVANSPRTTYACGSSDYDQRPGTFVKGKLCNNPKPMNTKPTVTPPPGFRIIPPEWLRAGNIAPDDMIGINQEPYSYLGWGPSQWRGQKVEAIEHIGRMTYASADPRFAAPTPDFRALCEEMVAAFGKSENKHTSLCDFDFIRGRKCDCGIDDILTRATARQRTTAILRVVKPEIFSLIM